MTIALGLNRRRTYPSVREIILVRFDPCVRDPFSENEIHSENEVNRNLQKRRDLAQKSLLYNPQQLATGPVVLSREVIRAAFDAISGNLADAVARLPNPDGLSRAIDIQPEKANRTLNSHRVADELEIEIPWKAVPFDPRFIRAMMVFHYEGTVDPTSYESAIRSRVDGVGNPTGYLVPATRENLKWIGLVDEMSAAHGDDGDVLQLKGRDLTGVLLDTKLPVGEKGTEGVRVQAGDTLQTAIRALLDTNPGFRDFIRGPLLRIAPGSRLPNLDPALYPRISLPPKERHRRARGEGRGFILRYPPKVAGDTSYWDAITDMCVSHALRPTIEQEFLVLIEPRTLYKFTPELLTQPGTPSFPKPNGHRVQIGDTKNVVRRMVYGDNISALRFHRKFGKVKVPTIEVVGTDPNQGKNGRRVVVKYPAKKRATKVDPAGKKPSEEFHRVVISGIVDKSQLLRIAEQTYEEMGRQETGVTISTDELASFSDHPNFDPNLEPDLLDLRAGDPMQILITPAQRDRSVLLSLSEMNLFTANANTYSGENDAVEILVREGWKREDAIQVVDLLRNKNLPTEFRVIAASYQFDAQSGMHLEIDTRNYIRVRADPDDIANTRALGLQEPGGIVRSGSGT